MNVTYFHRYHVFAIDDPRAALASATELSGAMAAMRTMLDDEHEADSARRERIYALVTLDEHPPEGTVGGNVDAYRGELGREPELIGYPWGTLAAHFIAAARSDVRASEPEGAHQPSPRALGRETRPLASPPPPDGAGGALRFVLVLDEATCIPAMVVIPHRAPGLGRRVAWRAGYAPGTPYAIVTDLTNLETQSDPFAWTNTTMSAFHRLILESASTDHLCTLNALAQMPDGQEVNVELYRRRVVNREDV